MGWEYRNGSRHYYRKERSGSRVRSVYVGRGDIAELSAALDEMTADSEIIGVEERTARARDFQIAGRKY